jgi:hypothetical protein
MDDHSPKGLAESSVPDTSDTISPSDSTYDYSTEKQLDDRVHTVSPLDAAAQAPEVVSEAAPTDNKKDIASATSTAYSTEKQLNGRKDELSQSKTDDSQFSTEKQHRGPEDEESNPKYPAPREDQPGLEHTSNARANAPEPFVGCRTIEPDGNLQTESRSQRPPADETSWHSGFFDCFSPASLCKSAQNLA